MNAEQKRLAREIMADAVEKADLTERAAFIEGACGHDAELRHLVNELVRAHEQAGGFLQQTIGVADDRLLGEGPGTLLGRYKLLQQIGEGGFGVVFMAEQLEPVQRMVALKIIKAGMDTRQVIARFEAERRALALMDHPSVARVLDAGTTGSGRPYFVMELVRGIKITDYCEQSDLDTAQRLRLFIKVCQAVEHAHQKGIIHRDLKPGNILITTVDGEAVPKVIDFGVVKAIGQKLTTQTLFTRFEEFIGTPAYMSPEQAEFSGVDLDTRSDIYALGVLLYELLTGSTPFDRETLGRAGLDEMRRIIRETEPPRPSTRLTALARAQKSELRSCKWIEVHGDLDWIVMKCLEKDRGRRYASASTLALDIQRHLNCEPVAARPPGALYRSGKFIRRHRVGVGFTASLALALIGGLVAALIGFNKAREERDRAIVAETDAQKQQARAEQMARQEADQRQRAETNLRRFELQAARDLFARDKSARGLSMLAARLRQDPTDALVCEWLMNELMHRNHAVPARPPILLDDLVTSARFSPDGSRILTAARDNTGRVWDADSGRPVSPWLRHDPGLVKGGEFLAGVHPLVAAFSPDGRRVVTGSIDGTARIWDSATGVLLTPPMPHSNWISWVVFSPDGRFVATACKDGTAQVWNAATGEPTGVRLQHGAWVNSVEFSPDGRWLATASDDQTAQVWDAVTGLPVGLPLRHRREVAHAAFSPDGLLVATASGDMRARIWHAGTGEPATQPLVHGGAVLRVGFSPDGTILATACWDKTARLWHALTGEPVGKPLVHEDVVRSVRFSPEGSRVVTASRDKTARVWDLLTQEPLTEPMRHHNAVWTAEFSPDGQRVLTASADRSAQVWDVRPGQALLHAWPHPMRITSVDWSGDGRRVLAISPRRAHIWEPDSGHALEGLALALLQGITSATFSPDGQSLAITTEDGTARIYDGHGQKLLAPPLKHDGPVLDASFSPDGRFVATASGDRKARLWEFPSGRLVGQPWPHDDSVRSVRFSPDGRRAATASADKSARIWSVPGGESVGAPLQHEDVVVEARFSPSGKEVVTASWDHSARVWDAATGAPLSPPLRHLAPITSAQFSPDGLWVVTASADETARIWAWQQGESVGQPLAHQGRVNGAEFSPDGRRVLTASVDGTAGLWDAPSGFRLSTGLKHQALVEDAQFSPDGSRIATAPFDYKVRLWEIATASGPAPAWLPELAEAVAGERATPQGAVEDVPVSRYLELQGRLAALPARDAYARWAHWFVADRFGRMLSPTARHSARQQVADLTSRWLNQDFLPSWFEAAKLEPTNGLVFAGIAWNYLELASTDPATVKTMDWHSRRAMELSPDQPIVWRTRARALEQTGDTNGALAVLERGRALNEPYYLSEWAGALERAGRIAEAWEKWECVLSLLEARNVSTGAPPLGFCRYGNEFLRRHATALGPGGLRGLDRFRGLLGIPARDASCPARLLDLTAFYSTGLDNPWLDLEPRRVSLDRLPHGRAELAGTPYDLRGLVQLSSATLSAAQVVYPTMISGISVHERARRLHFLHATDVAEAEGKQVASYVAHYADGQKLEVPLLHGRDIQPWIFEGDVTSPEPPRVAWRHSGGGGITLQLCQFTWENPRPDAELATLDFVSQMTQAAPFVVGITAEP